MNYVNMIFFVKLQDLRDTRQYSHYSHSSNIRRQPGQEDNLDRGHGRLTSEEDRMDRGLRRQHSNEDRIDRTRRYSRDHPFGTQYTHDEAYSISNSRNYSKDSKTSNLRKETFF